MMTAYAVVGLPARMPPWSKSSLTIIKGAVSRKTSAEDIFFSDFSSLKAKGDAAPLSLGGSFGFPRVPVAGAKPTLFASQMRQILRGQFRMISGNCFSGVTEELLRNEDSEASKGGHHHKGHKITYPDVVVRPDGDHENSHGWQGDVSHDGTLDLTAAAKLFERLTTEEDFGEFKDFGGLKDKLRSVLKKRLKELSEMKPTYKVGLEIADSVCLLMLLGSSNPNFNGAGKKAGRGAMMLQKGTKLLIEGQKLLRSSTSDA